MDQDVTATIIVQNSKILFEKLTPKAKKVDFSAKRVYFDTFCSTVDVIPHTNLVSHLMIQGKVVIAGEAVTIPNHDQISED